MKSLYLSADKKISSQSLFEFDQEAYPQSHWRVNDFESELSYGHLLCAIDEAQNLGGILLFRVMEDSSDLMHLSVLAKRQGWGQKLMKFYFEQLKSHYPRVERVMLEVKVNNLAAMSLYTSMGFCKLQERQGYYPDGKSAFVLEKWLTKR
ncbi:GNAT family N-acetyltransferase [bacterium]|nr:GNAT family N-acetyltransferase [bacterium]